MAQTFYFPLLFLFTIYISLASSLPCSTPIPPNHKNKNEHKNLVYSSCANASYPNLCIQTLSSYSGKANTPRDLAKAAVGVSLAKARNVSESLETLKGHTKREKSTLNDCMEQVGDSVYDLKKTLNELQHLRRDSFAWQMSNAQTWVSSALTNEDSCVDGFMEIDWKVRADLKKKISIVAKVTSNALYLINLLDQSQH